MTPAEFARAADQDGPGSDVRRHLDCVSRGLSVTRTRRVCAVKLSRGSGASFAPEAPADLGRGAQRGRIETTWRIWITFLGIFGVAPQGENPYVKSVVRHEKRDFPRETDRSEFLWATEQRGATLR